MAPELEATGAKVMSADPPQLEGGEDRQQMALQWAQSKTTS
jgi:hypothetical protein